VDGEQVAFTQPELAGLLDQIVVIAAQRSRELERLATSWGDWYEDFQIGSKGQWAARRRGGDGLDITGLTADELNTLLRQDRDAQEARPCRA
jgi:hypothetical protein